MSRLIRRGFTLSELLIVIAVIGILSSMMMVASTNSVRTSRADTVINTLRNFSAAAMTFYTDSMDHFTRNPNDTVNTTAGLKNWVKKYMYSEGSTIQNEENYTVWNNSGTWWAGYDLTKDNDKDGIKERLTNRARSAGLVGSEGITSYPAKINGTNKYNVYNGENAVWILIRTNGR